jgi:hypothetical protein
VGFAKESKLQGHKIKSDVYCMSVFINVQALLACRLYTWLVLTC